MPAAEAVAAAQLETLSGCQLAIGAYPAFRYDAAGGGGPAALGPEAAGGRRALRFAPQTLTIPALRSGTTRWLGLPLPPGLQIEVIPLRLEGWLEAGSGAIELAFEARFQFSALGLYRPPALQVCCTLSSGACRSQRHQRRGSPLSAAGEATLVGVALVPPSGDPWLDRFLGLPDEALAVLRCRLRAPG